MPRTLYRVSEENAPNNPPCPITPPYVIICTSFISSMDCINFVCITISLKRPIVPKSDNTETNTVKIITVCRDQQTTIRHVEGSLNVSVGVVNKNMTVTSHIAENCFFLTQAVFVAILLATTYLFTCHIRPW